MIILEKLVVKLGREKKNFVTSVIIGLNVVYDLEETDNNNPYPLREVACWYKLESICLTCPNQVKLT